jgi:hypothetical protein
MTDTPESLLGTNARSTAAARAGVARRALRQAVFVAAGLGTRGQSSRPGA